MINYKRNKSMKIIKAVLLISVISFFISFPFDVKAATDCSEVKELHKKIACKLNLRTSKDPAASAEAAETKAKSNEGKSWFKRILEMGGKNVGGEG